jgi:glycosyltransferase involved in cell wall biosynthesis
MGKKICIIANGCSIYRLPIFKSIYNYFHCTFYFGCYKNQKVKQFDYSEVPGFKSCFKINKFGNLYWQHNLLKILKEKYDYYIITGEPYAISSWIFLIIARIKNKKTIAWTHGLYGREKGLRLLFKVLYFKLFSKLLVFNEYSIKIMKENGIQNNKMFCIANSLDSDVEKEIRCNLKKTDIYARHFGNNYPVIIYCGRIQKWKKLDLLVDSLYLLNKDGINANLVFIGNDVDGVDLLEKVSNKNMLKKVWMYGACYDDQQLGELFYNADVCVSPGNVGLTAIHSLTFGCPVITHDNFSNQVPEFEAIEQGKTGDFFKENNVFSLKETIKKWINITSEEKDAIRTIAYSEIDRKWNIHYQIDVLKKIIE